MANTTVRVLAASLMIGAACWVLLAAVGPRWHSGPIAEASVVAASLLIVAFGGHLALRVLRVEELATVDALLASLWRRLRGPQR
jgi:hypothetical protein